MPRLQDCRRPYRRQQEPFPPLPGEQKRRRERAVHQHDFPRQPVHSGQRGNPRQNKVSSLSVAQQFPRKGRDPCQGKLRRHPEKRSCHQRAPQRGIASGNHGHEQPKQPVIQRFMHGRQEQNQQSHWRRYAAVPVHGVVHPVARSQVPQDPAHIRQQKTLPRACRRQPYRGVYLQCGASPGPQKCDEQRSHRDPREPVQPGQGKDHHLQNCRQQHQSPRPGANSSHVRKDSKVGFAMEPGHGGSSFTPGS